MINFQDNHYFKRLIYALETGGDSDYGFVEINSFQGKNDFIKQLRENCSQKIVEVNFSPKSKDKKEENTELVVTYQHFLTIENFRKKFGDEAVLVFTNLHETVNSLDENSVMELVYELNMNRENYARYPSTVLFIFPKWLMDKIFQKAHDLISMRAFHFDFTEFENDVFYTEDNKLIMPENIYNYIYYEINNTPILSLKDTYRKSFQNSGYPLLERLESAKKYIDVCSYYYIHDEECSNLFKEIKAFIENIDINSEKRANILFDIFSALGNYYQKFGDFKTALYYCEKVLEKINGKYEAEQPQKFISYVNLALVHANIREYEKSLGDSEKAHSIIDTTISEYKNIIENNPNNTSYYKFIKEMYAYLKNNLADAYKKTGDYDNALKTLKYLLSDTEKSLGYQHPDIAYFYNDIADTYVKIGDYETALKYFIKAYKIISNILGENNPKAENIFKNLSFCYRESGRSSSDFENWLKQQLKASEEE